MEKDLKIYIYNCMYNQIILLYTWIIVNQLYFNLKKLFLNQDVNLYRNVSMFAKKHAWETYQKKYTTVQSGSIMIIRPGIWGLLFLFSR